MWQVFRSMVHVVGFLCLLGVVVADDLRPPTPTESSSLSNLPLFTLLLPENRNCSIWTRTQASVDKMSDGGPCDVELDQSCYEGRIFICFHGSWQLQKLCSTLYCKSCQLARNSAGQIVHHSSCNVADPFGDGPRLGQAENSTDTAASLAHTVPSAALGEIGYATGTPDAAPSPVKRDFDPNAPLRPVISDIPSYRDDAVGSERSAPSLVRKDALPAFAPSSPAPVSTPPLPTHSYGPIATIQSDSTAASFIGSNWGCIPWDVTRFGQEFEEPEESDLCATPMAVACNADRSKTLYCDDDGKWVARDNCTDSSCGICGVAQPGWFTGDDHQTDPKYFGNPTPLCNVDVEDWTPYLNPPDCWNESTNATRYLPNLGDDCLFPQARMCTVVDDHPAAMECNLQNKWINIQNCTHTCHVCNAYVQHNYTSTIGTPKYIGLINAAEAICDWNTTITDLPVGPNATQNNLPLPLLGSLDSGTAQVTASLLDSTTAKSSVLYDSYVCLTWHNISNLTPFVAAMESSPCSTTGAMTCSADGNVTLRCNDTLWTERTKSPAECRCSNSSCGICGTVLAGYYADEGDPRFNTSNFGNVTSSCNIKTESFLENNPGKYCTELKVPPPDSPPQPIKSPCDIDGAGDCQVINNTLHTVECDNGTWTVVGDPCKTSCATCSEGNHTVLGPNSPWVNVTTSYCDYSSPLIVPGNSTIQPIPPKDIDSSIASENGTSPPANKLLNISSNSHQKSSQTHSPNPESTAQGTSEDPVHPGEGSKGQPEEGRLEKRVMNAEDAEQGVDFAKLDPRDAPPAATTTTTQSPLGSASGSATNAADPSQSPSASGSASSGSAPAASTSGSGSSTTGSTSPTTASATLTISGEYPAQPSSTNPKSIPDWQCFPWPLTFMASNASDCDVPRAQICNPQGNQVLQCNKTNDVATNMKWSPLGNGCQKNNTCAVCLTGGTLWKPDSQKNFPEIKAYCDYDSAKSNGIIQPFDGYGKVLKTSVKFNATQTLPDTGGECYAVNNTACSQSGAVIKCAFNQTDATKARAYWTTDKQCEENETCMTWVLPDMVVGLDNKLWNDLIADCSQKSNPAPTSKHHNHNSTTPHPTGRLPLRQEKIKQTPRPYHYPGVPPKKELNPKPSYKSGDGQPYVPGAQGAYPKLHHAETPGPAATPKPQEGTRQRNGVNTNQEYNANDGVNYGDGGRPSEEQGTGAGQINRMGMRPGEASAAAMQKSHQPMASERPQGGTGRPEGAMGGVRQS